MKKVYIVIIVIGVILLALIATIYWGISPFAKSYILKHDKELIGRRIELKDLKINPFTGKIELKNLMIFEANDSTPFVSLGHFESQIRLLKLLSNEVNIAYTTFDSLNVNIEQNESKFNFDDIIDHFKNEQGQDSTTEASKPWIITINQTRFDRSNLDYHDQVLDAHWGIENLSIVIPDISFSNKSTQVGVNLNFKSGGQLNFSTEYDLQEENLSLKIDLKKFAIDGILPYLKENLEVNKIEGIMDAQINFEANLNHLTEATLDGKITLANGAMTDNYKQKMECRNILIDIAKIDLKKGIYEFRKIGIDGLSLPFITEKDSTNNFTRLLKQTPPTKEAKTEVSEANSTPEPQILVKEFELKNGTVYLTDKTPSRAFELPITNISVRTKDFNPAQKNKVELKASLARSGTLETIWIGRTESLENMFLECRISNFNLTKTTPYMLDNFAYPIQNGSCSFTTKTEIRSNQLTSENHLDIYKLKLGSAEKQITPKYKVPLKLGLYVLSDVHDQIKIDLPVSGNIKSPDFSYKKALIKVFVNLLIKVGTTPTRFVSGLISGPANNLEFIEFDPSEAEFDSQGYFKLGEIDKIVNAKPELVLKLTKWPNYQKTINQWAEADTSSIEMGQKLILAEQRVKEIDQRRDSLLRSALTTRFEFKPEQYELNNIDMDSIKVYKGKSMYKVSFDIKQ